MTKAGTPEWQTAARVVVADPSQTGGTGTENSRSGSHRACRAGFRLAPGPFEAKLGRSPVVLAVVTR